MTMLPWAVGPGVRVARVRLHAKKSALKKAAFRNTRNAALVVGCVARDQAMSKRSAFITFDQAATKSWTNFSWLSSWA